MDKVRWETLVLAAAILLGALLISMAMRANRYYSFNDRPLNLLDTQTGTTYRNDGRMGGNWERRKSSSSRPKPPGVDAAGAVGVPFRI
jgi:hypothetical protein